MRIKPDKHSTANFYGFLEVQISGAWGSVCARSFDDKAATVACRQLGFAGGAAYNPPKNFSSPLLMDNIQCVGSEENLLKCAFSKWYVGTGCSYYSERAGVLCYNDTGIITLIILYTLNQVLYFDLMIACLQIQMFCYVEA